MFAEHQSMADQLAFTFFIQPIFQHFYRLKNNQSGFRDDFCSDPKLQYEQQNQMAEDGFIIDLVFRDENSTQVESPDNGDDEPVKYNYYSKEVIWLSLHYSEADGLKMLELENFYVRSHWYRYNQDASHSYGQFSLSDQTCYKKFHFATVLAGCLKKIVKQLGLTEGKILFNNVMEEDLLIRECFGTFSCDDRDDGADGYNPYKGSFKGAEFVAQYSQQLSGAPNNGHKRKSCESCQISARDNDAMDIDHPNEYASGKKMRCGR